jgi:hypothetical protein
MLRSTVYFIFDVWSSREVFVANTSMGQAHCNGLSLQLVGESRFEPAQDVQRRAHPLTVIARQQGNGRERKRGPSNMSTEAGPSVVETVALSCLGPSIA